MSCQSWKMFARCNVLTMGSKDFIPGYFTMLDWALNAKGAACFQVITIPEARFERCESIVPELF